MHRIAWLPPMLARMTLGVVFVLTGWGKLQALDRVTAFFGELGLPAPGFHAVLVSLTELGCGALLLLGLAARFAALPLIVTMVVAMATAQRAQIHGLADLFGLIEFAYVGLLVWIVVAGAGPVSLDHVVKTRRQRS